MNAFLTGSRRYGTPGPGSDWDIAIELTPETEHLRALDPPKGDDGYLNNSVRIGDVNLILLPSTEFWAWLDATEELEARAPVTRGEAVAVIERHVAEALGR